MLRDYRPAGGVAGAFRRIGWAAKAAGGRAGAAAENSRMRVMLFIFVISL